MKKREIVVAIQVPLSTIVIEIKEVFANETLLTLIGSRLVAVTFGSIAVDN